MEQWQGWEFFVAVLFGGGFGFVLGAMFASERKDRIIADLRRALRRNFCAECTRRADTRHLFDLESV